MLAFIGLQEDILRYSAEGVNKYPYNYFGLYGADLIFNKKGEA